MKMIVQMLAFCIGGLVLGGVALAFGYGAVAPLLFIGGCALMMLMMMRGMGGGGHGDHDHDSGDKSA